MHLRAPYRVIRATLAVVILVFNTGIPVTMYLCPMMSAENPTCSMSVPSFGDTPSITKQIPSCCAKYIVAERDSTPYLKSENHQAPDLSGAIAAIDIPTSLNEGYAQPVRWLDTGPPRSSPPLYLLTSTLLI